MSAFTSTLRSRLRPHDITVEQVHYRYRGWNGTHMSPVRDALEALDRANKRGQTRIGLVGHSMGGRVAAHLASQEGVESVVALAPWWPENDAEHIPAGRHLLVAHGTDDRSTDPRATQSQTMAARDRGVKARWRPAARSRTFHAYRPPLVGDHHHRLPGLHSRHRTVDQARRRSCFLISRNSSVPTAAISAFRMASLRRIVVPVIPGGDRGAVRRCLEPPVSSG